MHENCKPIFLDHCLSYFRPGMAVLEVGPAFPTPTWYEQQLIKRDHLYHRRWETVDVNPKRGKGGKHGDVTYVAGPHIYHAIVPECRYDIVFSSMVLEHTPRPWEWIEGVFALCKPRTGRIIIIAPFVGPEHGDDYWRVLPKGLRQLAEKGHFRPEVAELFELEPGDWRGPDTVHVDSLLIARKP